MGTARAAPIFFKKLFCYLVKRPFLIHLRQPKPNTMQIKIEKFEVVNLDYREVLPLQGQLKALSKDSERKLLESLKDKGKFVPEFVWHNAQDGNWYTLDGHSRLKVYVKHDVKFNDSYVVPFLSIQASDTKDAKEKLLLINSDYGKITESGLLDFVKDLDISADWMNTKLDMSAFHNFDFVQHARNMAHNLNKDLIDFGKNFPSKDWKPEDKNSLPLAPKESLSPQTFYQPPAEPIRQPRASDNDWHSITEIVPYSFKQQYVELLDRVCKEQGFAQKHEALQFIIHQFIKHQYHE